ncbi:MAG: Coenzyme F420 hydrogenase/dehydrogenase, beta subunit C-terminal domain [Acutalibacteraceae bacterium]|nr:Coenzyme F420 hydrogenase/dehydrogenase, beta subunit C-terminal domain [Acutalibacteraceae bacterium]
MQHIYLCGHTGSINHGCEAIVRATTDILKSQGYTKRPILMTTNAEQDERFDLDFITELLPYKKRCPDKILQIYSAVKRKILHNVVAGQEYIQAPLFNRVDNKDVCFNIGGDTYCYELPVMSIALNKGMKNRNVPTILWCCSIEKSALNNKIIDDLKKYRYIVVREHLTYNNLIDAGIDKKRILKCCDPAFNLEKKTVDLPEGFIKDNTLGLNVSSMVIKNTDMSDQGFANVINLIEHVLNKTDMGICLIPHVYDWKKQSVDVELNNIIYNMFKDTGRVSCVTKDYTCEQLKYIISNCRFFIGARTHATIAAYSTGVPTLVIGYSVKSKGIATDIFGTDTGYVVPFDELKKPSQLVDTFLGHIVANESQIKKRYAEFLPSYIKTVYSVTKKLLEEFDLINLPQTIDVIKKTQCSGCSACAQICPKECINMQQDKEGFLYPTINAEICIKCGKCSKVCPTLNVVETNKSLSLPKSYAAVNKNDAIRLNSSSGGVFTAIAECVLADDGVVFGATYNENFEVEHVVIDRKEELYKLRSSKYVQSRIGNCYCQAAEFLKSGRNVLFTGTPCQIEGLYGYLGKDYDNLFTQDIICHGCPSPSVWEKYLKEKNKEYVSTAKAVSFRNKDFGWKKYCVKIDFANGTSYSSLARTNSYMRSFLTNMNIRPSCSYCEFKKTLRHSDITLADFWGAENIIQQIDDKGLSLVIVHSPKGEKLLQDCENLIEKQEVELRKAVANNPSYTRSSEASPYRQDWFNKYGSTKIDDLFAKLNVVNIKNRVLWTLKQLSKKI